ncbi:hypothetical protein A2955_02575 [Candidatus Woesebacteria bacterium RIFCSPLOWO2_01_FULL_37_19]|uniref:Integral membrane protein n=2 Tax=Candidatus Woeseibacteriota TaxID=1752722 RepID=A0A1F8AYG0_9BACT|nr:MAG: hypothetical protein A2771_04060 [Candidatus Woesebacteria bacterium RIFCSPHIGHO2_01_FULL_38_26b]OGM56792.1 MAG: hypothetical protein A2955_02575 [Candidatus Woesebacteria bacterium RIFCSPLOWO2_01_FULL_37_19]
MHKIAQINIPLGNVSGFGQLGLENARPIQAPYVFNTFISILVGLLTIIAAIWFLIILITSAYSWMSAGGDKGAIETARSRMLNALIGLVIVIAAVFVVDLVGYILGFPLILNPGLFFNRLNP